MKTDSGTNGAAPPQRRARGLSAGDVVRDLVRRDDTLRASADGDADATDTTQVPGPSPDDGHGVDDDRAGDGGVTDRRDAVVLVVVLAIGLVVLGVTVWRQMRADGVAAESRVAATADATRSSATDGGSPGPASDTAAPTATSGPEVRVHVAGAVQRPGVYRLPTGARAEDAVAAAGGALSGAHVDGVNLAAEVRDGQQLTVPASPADVATVGGGGPVGADGGAEPVAPVDLNTATAEELDALPGVGPSTARRIIEHRERRPFASVRDLLEVPGIGDARYAELRDRVTV